MGYSEILDLVGLGEEDYASVSTIFFISRYYLGIRKRKANCLLYKGFKNLKECK